MREDSKLLLRTIVCCTMLFLICQNAAGLKVLKRTAGSFKPFERRLYLHHNQSNPSLKFSYRKRDVGKLLKPNTKKIIHPSSLHQSLFQINDKKPSWRQLPVLVIPDWLLFPANERACRLYIKSNNTFRRNVPCTYVEGYNAYLELDGLSCRLMRVKEQEIREVRLEHCLVPGRRLRTYIDRAGNCITTFAKLVPEVLFGRKGWIIASLWPAKGSTNLVRGSPNGCSNMADDFCIGTERLSRPGVAIDNH
uniref:Uncharacterized protein n=1 Tax=Romanomermis culicivorax TaxID=13658 RepID=A0A915JH11_ROMCU